MRYQVQATVDSGFVLRGVTWPQIAYRNAKHPELGIPLAS
jgi:hypothetical protein